MYVGACLDKFTDKVLIAERLPNGQRITNTVRPIYEFYVEDPDGDYDGLDGKSVRRIQCENSREFWSMRKKYEGQRTYEMNFNIVQKCLYKYYSNAELPKLNKSYMDIEVDLTSQPGIQINDLILEANCPINAISIYNDWEQTLQTFTLKPPSITNEEAKQIVSEFDNTILCENEVELLERTISAFENADVITGWNSCIKTDSSVWLKNKITSIDKIKLREELLDSSIMSISDITQKLGYNISSKLGNNIIASKDHIFPVSVYDEDKYVSKKSMKDNLRVISVEEMIKLQNENKQLFLHVICHNNNNSNLTYREYIKNNIDWVLNNYDISFDNLSKISIDYSKSKIKQRCYSRIKHLISKEEIIDYITNNDILTIYSNNKSGHFKINLSENINEDDLHMSGLLYTDGTIESNCLIFYNKNESIINKVSQIYKQYFKTEKSLQNNDSMYNGVYRSRLCTTNKLGLLRGFYYDNKKIINVELLSMLSESQFFAFFSGCIDGNGYISNNSIGFYNYNNDINKIKELLLWNNIITTNSTNSFLIKSSENYKIKNKLFLWADYKQQKLLNIKSNITNKSSSKAIKTNIKNYDNTLYVKLNKIICTNEIVNMIDISTSTGFFYSNGIKTHNCGFDIPYIVRRIENILGEGESKRLCLWDKEPTVREYNEYGKQKVEYTLIGKWSADYLLLYKKHTQGEHDSYKLDNIAFEELGERKVAYEGTLDELYYNDYKKFLDYNRQDTMLIVRLDDKLNYINIHNKQAHQIPCLLDTTMGTVGWFDQMVINEAHKKNKIVPDKENRLNPMFIDVKAPGAFVQDPVIGFKKWIGCSDLNSLYPSTIRCLNMSPETFVAQVQLNETLPYLRQKAIDNNLWKKKSESIIDWGASWGGDELFGTLEYQHIMKQTDDMLELVFANGTRVHKTAKEIYDIVFNDNSNLCISAFGTIFRTDVQGLVAGILSDWYAERKAYKKKKYEYECLCNGITIDNELASLLK